MDREAEGYRFRSYHCRGSEQQAHLLAGSG
jgi:hypothetical protein